MGRGAINRAPPPFPLYLQPTAVSLQTEAAGDGEATAKQRTSSWQVLKQPTNYDVALLLPIFIIFIRQFCFITD